MNVAAAVITYNEENGKYQVENLIVIDRNDIIKFKDLIGCDYLVEVNDTVQIGDFYNPETGIFTNPEGERIYPPLTLESLEARVIKIETELLKPLDIIVKAINDTSALLKKGDDQT